MEDLSYLTMPEPEPEPDPKTEQMPAAPAREQDQIVTPEPQPLASMDANEPESVAPEPLATLDFMAFQPEPPEAKAEPPEAVPDPVIDSPYHEPEPELSITEFVQQMDDDQLDSYQFKDSAPATLIEYRFRLETLKERIHRKTKRKEQVQAVFAEFSQFMTECRMFYLLTKEHEKASKIAADLKSKFESTPRVFFWKRQRLEAASFKSKTTAGQYKTRRLAEDKRLREMAEELTEKALANADLGAYPKHIGQKFRLRHVGASKGTFDKASVLILQEAQDNVNFAVSWHEMALQNLIAFEAAHGHMVKPGAAFADEIAAELIASK